MPDLSLGSQRIYAAPPSPQGPSDTFRAGVINIEANEIVSVEWDEDYRDRLDELARSGARVCDFSARPITPAFINAHTHLALNFLRGGPSEGAADLVEDYFFHYESRLAPADVRAFARVGAFESLTYGVGLVWDHYYFGQAVAEGCRDAGLAAVVAPTLQDLGGPGSGQAERGLAATEAIANDDTFARAGIFAALGPHATDTVSDALWSTVLEAAERLELPIHMHVAQSCAEVERILSRSQTTPLTHLMDRGLADVRSALLVHCLFARDSEVEALDSTRHVLGYCPYSQLLFGRPAPVQRWRTMGRSIAIGTDCAASNDSMNVQKELRFAAGWQRTQASWSTPYEEFLLGSRSEAAPLPHEAPRSVELLRSLWDIPGGLHPSFRAGVIETGGLANLAIWDHEHPCLWPATDLPRALAMGDPVPALHALFVAGVEIGETGRVAASIRESDAYRSARQEADDRLNRLMAG